MAFLMARMCLNTFENLTTKFSPFYIESININIRKKSSKRKKPKVNYNRGTIKHRNLIASSYESLAARDFLRYYKAYEPPGNIKEKIVSVCLNVLGTKYSESLELSREDKYEILTTCFNEINHGVPNSLLHEITTPQDIIRFYKTPVDKRTPYDVLLSQELPPNLHIQAEYVRFNPDKDSIFGINAFPESSTIMTGLESKQKYKGHKAELRPLIDDENFFTKENVFKVT